MNWRCKYAIQRGLSLLPFDAGVRVNRLLSRRFGGLRETRFYNLPNTLAMCSLLQRQGFDARGATVVELGTGWTAGSAAILLSLGAAAVHSFDLYRHLDEGLTARALEEMDRLGEHAAKQFPFACDLPGLAAACGRGAVDLGRFRYHAPHDARATGLPGDSVDLYFSQAVLEHVPEPVIAGLLRESHRVLKPGGLCYHYVQPTMHATWVDPGSTGIDYLTCSDRTWRLLYDNGIAHENRLRAPCYVQLVREAGFAIEGTWHTVDAKALASLAHKRVAPRFQSYTREELATDYLWILARKSA